jgi:uncharacterized protein YdeI (YjbR/CyaY-like superfamily)
MAPGTIATGNSRVRAAQAAFEALAPGRRRAYLRWTDDAGPAVTARRRIAGTVERLNQGRAERSNGEG